MLFIPSFYKENYEKKMFMRKQTISLFIILASLLPMVLMQNLGRRRELREDLCCLLRRRRQIFAYSSRSLCPFISWPFIYCSWLIYDLLRTIYKMNLGPRRKLVIQNFV